MSEPKEEKTAHQTEILNSSIMKEREKILAEAKELLGRSIYNSINLGTTQSETEEKDPAEDYLRQLEGALSDSESKVDKSKLEELIKRLRENFALEASYRVAPLIGNLVKEFNGQMGGVPTKEELITLGARAQLGNSLHRLLDLEPDKFFKEILEPQIIKAGLTADLASKIRTEARRLASRLYPDWQLSTETPSRC